MAFRGSIKYSAPFPGNYQVRVLRSEHEEIVSNAGARKRIAQSVQ
jgi:hypothetical protein